MDPYDEFTVQNATVLTMEPGWEPVIADVQVAGGVIRAVGTEVRPRGAVVDGSGAIVLPGFVDSHRHVWQAALRGIGSDFTLKDYLRSVRLHLAKAYRPEDMYAGNYVGLLEAADSGITAVLDHSHNVLSVEHAEQALQGSIDAGVRTVFAYGLNEPPASEAALSVDSRLELAQKLAGSIPAGQDLVTIGLALPDAWRSGADSISRGIDLARRYGWRISLHACTKLLRTPVSEVAVLRELGLVGDDMTWVHMNLADDEELRFVLDAGGAVSVTPDTEMQMGMGAPVTGRVLREGRLPSFGADVVCSAPGDHFATMRMAMQAERLLANLRALRERGTWIDEVELKARTVLEAATLGGARALGLEDRIGSLRPGKQADLIVVRPDRIGAAPATDPVGTLVTHCSAADVEWVFVAGRAVKADGRLVDDRWRELAAQTHHHIAAVIREEGVLPSPPAPLPE